MANTAPNIEQAYSIVCGTDDEAAWLEARKSGIGASEMPRVLGVAPASWGTAFQLYHEKIGTIEPADLDDVEAIQWGKLLEPLIIKQYERRAGRKVSPGGVLLRSKRHPWALATLDAWTTDGRERWPLQVKNVNAFRAEDWVDGPPEYYAVQVQQEALVVDAPRTTIAALLGGNRLVWLDVERDEVAQRRIVYHGERFWQRLVDGEPPPVDSSEGTRLALSKLYPQDSGEVVELPAELLATVEEWRAYKTDAKRLEDDIRACENEIKAALGNATRGVFAGSGDSVSWKQQERAAYSVPAGQSRVLRYHKSK